MNRNFSVLLSVYYKENPLYLSDSLDSIFTQTQFPTEVILVKDGPLSVELDVVIARFKEKYSELKVVSLPQNGGLGNALNEGLKYCSYDLVARMDTDDIAKSNRFEKQLAVFEKHPEYDVVGSWIDEFSSDVNEINSTRKTPETPEGIYVFGKKRNPLSHPSVMFRKRAVLAVGSYKHFPLFEDYYLWIRMMLNGSKCYNIQESLLYFRMSPDMFKRRGGWKYACDEIRFQQKLLQMGYIDRITFLKNVCIRFGTRIIPNSFRGYIYKKLLRK